MPSRTRRSTVSAAMILPLGARALVAAAAADVLAAFQRRVGLAGAALHDAAQEPLGLNPIDRRLSESCDLRVRTASHNPSSVIQGHDFHGRIRL